LFFFSSRRRHTRFSRDWSSDVCSSDLINRVMNPTDMVIENFGWPCYEGPNQTGGYNGLDFCIDYYGGTNAHPLAQTTAPHYAYRSEERRVGKECRSR